jgi:hypothetical protein
MTDLEVFIEHNYGPVLIGKHENIDQRTHDSIETLQGNSRNRWVLLSDVVSRKCIHVEQHGVNKRLNRVNINLSWYENVAHIISPTLCDEHYLRSFWITHCPRDEHFSRNYCPTDLCCPTKTKHATPQHSTIAGVDTEDLPVRCSCHYDLSESKSVARERILI